jgi:hypothetical protein
MIARGLAGPARPLTLFLVLVAGAVAVEAVLLIGSPQAPYWMLMTLPGSGLVYAVVGALAWVRRPEEQVGGAVLRGRRRLAGVGDGEHRLPRVHRGEAARRDGAGRDRAARPARLPLRSAHDPSRPHPDGARLPRHRRGPTATLLRQLVGAQTGITFVTLGEHIRWATVRQWGGPRRADLR